MVVRPPILWSALLFTTFISLVAASMHRPMVLLSSPKFVSQVSCQCFGSLVSAPTVHLFSYPDCNFGLVNGEYIGSLDSAPSFHWLSRRLFIRQFNGPSASLWSALLFTGYSAFISQVAASMVLPPSPRFVSQISCQSFCPLVSAPTCSSHVLASFGTFAQSIVSPSVHSIVHRLHTGYRVDCSSVNSMFRPPSLWSARLFTGYSAFISLVAASMVLLPSPSFVSQVTCQSFGPLVSAQTVYFFSPRLVYFWQVNGQSIGSLDSAPSFHWLSRRLFIRQFNGPSARSMASTSVHWIFSLYFATSCIDCPSAKSKVCQVSCQFLGPLVSAPTVYLISPPLALLPFKW